MKKNWKLASAALLIAIAVPVTAYAADNLGSHSGQADKKASLAAETVTPAGKQGEKPAPGKLRLDLQTLAKTKLGLDQAAFEQAQKAGKSLADIAKEKGEELQPLIDELSKEINADILANLGSKDLTDQEKENVKKKASMEAERIFTEPLNKERTKQEGSDLNLAAALEILGIDKAAFADQVHAGKSLVDIGKEYNVTRQRLMDALLSTVNAKIEELKKSGTITQEQADKKKQAALQDAEDFVDHTPELFKKKESFAGVPTQDAGSEVRLDFQQIAAAKLGLDKEAFQKALEAGKSLADLAKEKSIEVEPLIDEVTKEICDEIQAKSTIGFTDEQKENIHKKATAEAERVFNTPLNKEQEVREQGVGEYNLMAAFELLGIDKATFAEQVQAGKSFADIAKDHGGSRQKLIEVLMSDITAKLDAGKAKGDITQEQADQKKQAAQKEVEDFVDHTASRFETKEKK
ncbi:hypothetical protein SAMN02799624_00283 [Paenibacillus sp. UNC496MF]|uniref:hypothetical protein n=1 Tax=Paenibacillus sp. UNC496MF TaxID=1502753 RepID=UPI0008E189D0|nr:hypothetical protein [Paenibacillus sp. UNC496MF]SFI31205.1 hypothetical protein SAMN02799624_00283 [Paenibacillus sp. UNC496MF]